MIPAKRFFVKPKQRIQGQAPPQRGSAPEGRPGFGLPLEGA